MATDRQIKEAQYVHRGDDGDYLDEIGQCGFTCDYSKIVKDDKTGKNYRYCTKLQMQVFDYDSCKFFCNDEQVSLLGQLSSMLTRSDFSTKKDHELVDAARKGDRFAIYELASRFEKRQDYVNAIKFYTRACELGDADAPLKVARLFDSQKRYKDAAPFFQMAVERTNDASAHITLAKYYVMGFIGSFFNREKKAFEHFLAAAKQGNSEAQYFVALAYSEGSGVRKSIEEYIFWIRCSQLNGYQKAVQLLNERMSDRQYTQAWKEELAKADKRISNNEEYIEEYIRRQVRKEIDAEKKGK